MKKSLRLNQNEIETIKKVLFELFGEIDIYIFGSQTDLSKRGGDIDIFIPKKLPFEKKLKAKILLQEKLLKKIDLIDHKNFDREIEKEGLRGVRIT